MKATVRSRYWELRLAMLCLGLALRHHLLSAVRRALGIPRRPDVGGFWTVRHLDRRGRLLWADAGHNLWHDEGEQWLLQVAFTEAQSVPANFYIGLDARTSLAEADTLASLVSEPSTNGYARQPVASDATADGWAVTQVGGDYRATSKTVTFTASGGSIGPVTKMFVCTVVSGTGGKLVASRALSQSRTLANGESLQVSYYVSVGE
jgi:hypothetical protein